VPILWPLIFETGCQIQFAHTSFKWANLASHNAGVTVAIIGITAQPRFPRRLYSVPPVGARHAVPLPPDSVADKNDAMAVKEVEYINAYLVSGSDIIVGKALRPLSGQAEMNFGNKPVDGGHLLLSKDEANALNLALEQHNRFIRNIYGSAEFIRGLERYCLWIEDEHWAEARTIPKIQQRLESVRAIRLASPKDATVEIAKFPYRFGEVRQSGSETVIIVPSVSSESRDYLPCGYAPAGTIVSNLAFALYDAPLWNMALIASRLHLVWIATVCGKLKTDFRYSNTLGWNTFPVPLLTEQNKTDLTTCAENILLAREAHFPATIADLYDPDNMPDNLRAAHARNDEVLERIYIGRRFKNDTERLEKLFELYTKMTASASPTKGKRHNAGANT
jgi:hypothetical protein